MSRSYNRTHEEARPIRITTGFTKHAEGSVLVETGETKVICTASVEEKVPSFLRGKGQGWVTAEYAMLPRATGTRVSRERGKVGGRTQEIQRLIGRSLRAAVDLNKLGERSIQIDCDVIQADGGTRTASITGAWVALSIAIQGLKDQGLLSDEPMVGQVAAISLGKIEGALMLDLDYHEDSNAEVDLNLVMIQGKGLIEIQGTAEGAPFSLEELTGMVELGGKGLEVHYQAQLEAVKS